MKNTCKKCIHIKKEEKSQIIIQKINKESYFSPRKTTENKILLEVRTR